MALSKREQLLEMAIELFFKGGCHTTGIDKLLAQAGVAKMTLYSHFKSKEDLILAAAERLHEQHMERLRTILQDSSKTPLERHSAVFDYLEQFVNVPEYSGCPFQKLAVEFSDPAHPIHQMAARHKREVEDAVTNALEAQGFPQARSLARQFLLLSEGAQAMIQITGDHSYLQDARAAGERIVAELYGLKQVRDEEQPH